MNISRRAAVTALPQSDRCLLLTRGMIPRMEGRDIIIQYLGGSDRVLLVANPWSVVLPITGSLGMYIHRYEDQGTILWFA
jgi:hypothetical protein